MRQKYLLALATVALVAFLTSCIPQRQVVLVQDAKPEESLFKTTDQVTERYILKPNDYLFIFVSSPNPDLSAFYNPQSNMRGTSTNMRSDLFYYGLDDSCCIDFPVAGRINLKGCSVHDAKERIYEAVSRTLTGFSLTVRLATNTFSILGEVVRQGNYTMGRDQMTVFDAVSMAGGFTSYAKRREVKLMRKNENGEVETHVLDLTKGGFIESDYYYIYPNDVIYVRPLWFKMFGFSETFSVSLATSLVTLYVLIRSL